MDLLSAAVAENAAWCAMVSRWHGVGWVERDGLALALGSPPPFYPAAITLRPGLDLTDSRLPATGGLKDSFADLELAPAGFSVLFTADWLARDAGHGRATAWEVVDGQRQLDVWRAASGGAEAIRPQVLAEPTVALLARPAPDGVLAGAIAHRDEDAGVIGISNVYGDFDWDELAAAAADRLGELPVVGYEHGTTAIAAEAAGFRRSGPLRVWAR